MGLRLWFSLECSYLLSNLLIFLITALLLAQTTSSLSAVDHELKRLEDLKNYYYVEESISGQSWAQLERKLRELNITYYLREELIGAARIDSVSLRLKLINFSQVPEIAKHQLVRGRYPEKAGECLITEFLFRNLSISLPQSVSVNVLFVTSKSLNYTELNYSCKVVGTYAPREFGIEFMGSLITDQTHFVEVIKRASLDPSSIKLNVQLFVIMFSKDYEGLRSIAKVPPVKVFALRYDKARKIYEDLKYKFSIITMGSLAIGVIMTLSANYLAYASAKRYLAILTSQGRPPDVSHVMALMMSSQLLGIILGAFLGNLGPFLSELLTEYKASLVYMWRQGLSPQGLLALLGIIGLSFAFQALMIRLFGRRALWELL